MDQFLDAAVFATGTTANGKKPSTGTGAISPVTSPILSASASGGTRVFIYIRMCFFFTLARFCCVCS